MAKPTIEQLQQIAAFDTANNFIASIHIGIAGNSDIFFVSQDNNPLIKEILETILPIFNKYTVLKGEGEIMVKPKQQ